MPKAALTGASGMFHLTLREAKGSGRDVWLRAA